MWLWSFDVQHALLKMNESGYCCLIVVLLLSYCCLIVEELSFYSLFASGLEYTASK